MKAFLETGQFPNGTVLIKEARKIISRTLTTAPAVWAGDTSVWFVMIKDTKGRFKDSANWGEGWGWALFEAPNRNINTSKDYLESCLPCHVPAEQTDWDISKAILP